MTLSEKQRKHLRSLGHPMKPVVMVGNQGLTEAVLAEVHKSIEHHELMKIRVTVGDRDARDEILHRIAEHCSAELVQRIGNIGLFFRPRKKNTKISLPQ